MGASCRPTPSASSSNRAPRRRSGRPTQTAAAATGEVSWDVQVASLVLRRARAATFERKLTFGWSQRSLPLARSPLRPLMAAPNVRGFFRKPVLSDDWLPVQPTRDEQSIRSPAWAPGPVSAPFSLLVNHWLPCVSSALHTRLPERGPIHPFRFHLTGLTSRRCCERRASNC